MKLRSCLISRKRVKMRIFNSANWMIKDDITTMKDTQAMPQIAKCSPSETSTEGEMRIEH